MERPHYGVARPQREDRERAVAFLQAAATQRTQLLGGEVAGERLHPPPMEGAALGVEGQGGIDFSGRNPSADAVGLTDHGLVSHE